MQPDQLPNSWLIVTIGECFLDIRNGTTVTQSTTGQGAPVSRIETIQKSQFDLSRVRFIENPSDELIETYRYERGDIALSHINSYEHVGKTALYQGNPPLLIHGMNLLRLRLGHNEIDPAYAHYFMLTNFFRDEVKKRVGHAVNQVSINQKKLSEVPFTVAPLNEQRRIAAKLERLLSRVNKAQERLATIPRILKRFRQSVLSAASSGQLTADWRAENLASSSWSVYSLSQIGSVTGGVTKNAQRAQMSLKRPYLRVANVYENRLMLDDVFEIGITEQEWIRTKLLKHDLLFVEGNGSLEQIGRVALWDASIKDCVHQNHLIKFRAGEKVLPTYVLFQMMSPFGRTQLVEKATSSAGLNTLSISKISDIRIAVPGIDEQEEIIRRVEALFRTADALEERYLKAKAHVDKLTQSILAKAFRGELVPQDPNDEPASVLLKRIAGGPNGSDSINSRPTKARKRRRT